MRIHSIIILFILLASCEVSINKNHVEEGYKLISNGDYINADLEFEDELFINPENIEALRGSYLCSMNLGNIEKALKNCNSYIKLKPNAVEGYNDRGTLFLMNKDYINALKDFDKTLSMDSSNPLISYFNKGQALSFLDRNEEAISCFNYVINLDPKDARAYYKKGLSFQKLGNKDSSCLQFNIAKNLGDKDAENELSKFCK